ncbi:unnamed protein product [Closterium sp. NIES-65]|nr:unnamed protein product [Closterium sp. NIES-65]
MLAASPAPAAALAGGLQAACPPQHGGARGGARACTGWLTGGELRGALSHSAAQSGLSAHSCRKAPRGAARRGAPVVCSAAAKPAFGRQMLVRRRRGREGRGRGRGKGVEVTGDTHGRGQEREQHRSKGMRLVMVPPHPLIKHWIAILRNATSPPPIFRQSPPLHPCSMLVNADLMCSSACPSLSSPSHPLYNPPLLPGGRQPMINGEVATPCGVAEVEAVDPYKPIAIIPVLRAGAVMAEQMGPVIPHTITYHLANALPQQVSALCPTPPPLTPLTAACTALLLCQSFLPSHPTHPFNAPLTSPILARPLPHACTRLPKSFNPEARIIIVDAMLATGGTMMATMEEVVGRGANPDNIRIISAIVASPALKLLIVVSMHMSALHPSALHPSALHPSALHPSALHPLRVYTGMIDADVNDQGFIVPGLGDAGDRSYGTL